MMELTSEARELVNRYLHRTRLSLRGTSVEVKEVERDIVDHIEAALAGREEPAGAADLAGVLERLGSPTQWVPEEEIPLWRRTLANLTAGPEDWRLAYLCFAMTTLGLLTLTAGGIVLLAGAIFVSRASISLAEQRDEPLGARRWLIYPPLVFVCLMLIFIPVAAPIFGIADFAADSWRQNHLVFAGLGIDGSPGRLVALVVAAAGAWWVILAGIAAMLAKPVRWALVPLADGFRPAHAVWLATIGGVLMLGSGAAWMIL